MAISQLLIKHGGMFHKLTLQQLNEAIRLNEEYDDTDLELMEEGMFFSYSSLATYLHTYLTETYFSQLTLPILFAHGRFDFATPLQLLQESTILKGANRKLVVFENAGHFPMWEEPEKFSNEVLAFIK
jgi:proline iminopeptidase